MEIIPKWEELTIENLIKTKSDPKSKLFKIGEIDKLLSVYTQSHFESKKDGEEDIIADANLSKIIAEFDYLTDGSNETPDIKYYVGKYRDIQFEAFDKKREEIKKFLLDNEELNG